MALLCPACRGEIDAAAVKCMHCGESLRVRSTNRLVSGLAILAVLAVIWVVIAIVA